MSLIERLSWLWISLGWVGAIAVIIGVWGEEHFDRKVLPYNKQEKLKFRFWMILLGGLAIELVGIIGTTFTSLALENRIEMLRAANDSLEHQMMETKTNIAIIDPLNRPVTSATAKTYLRFSDTNIWKNAKMSLIVCDKEGRHLLPTLTLKSISFQYGWTVIEFSPADSPSFLSQMAFSKRKAGLINSADTIELIGDSSFRHEELIDGRALLQINDMQKNFRFRKSEAQFTSTVQFIATNFPYLNSK